MNGITITKFGDSADPVRMAKQLAQAVNRIEQVLQNMPFFFGTFDPNGIVTAQTGSVFIRSGAQGENSVVATPKIYLKTTNDGSGGWLALLYTGTQVQTDVTANRGSLYLKVPSELTGTAVLYLKQTADATATGWTVL